MKSLWRKITGGLEGYSGKLAAFGPAGLFAVAFVDAALVPLPLVLDAAMVSLSMARPALMPVNALAAALGSTLGCLFLYSVSRKAGGRALRRFSERKRERVRLLLDRYDVLSVFVVSLLPPPFPFKLFVISAGVFRLNAVRFAAAIAAGRLLRFLLEGYLAVRYGEEAREIFSQNFPAVGLAAAALAALYFVLRRVAGRRKARRGAEPSEAGEG